FEIYDEKLFTHVVKAAFVQRRKMLKNSLKPLLSSLNSEAFGELEFFFSKRPEELKPEEFAHIANIIHENRKCLKN
ncbi:MAG: 16S rRNA (adenine(1518)-N(6)/adenine(1519)-N(6))-dimethyltransferase, partial [Thermoplasmata archaeon]